MYHLLHGSRWYKANLKGKHTRTIKMVWLAYILKILWNHLVHGKPMFVALVGNPCPRIYVPTNVYAIICLIFIYEIDFAPNEIKSPRTKNILVTHEHLPFRIKMIPQHIIFIFCRFTDAVILMHNLTVWIITTWFNFFFICRWRICFRGGNKVF